MSNRPIIDWEEWLASPPGQYMLRWESQQYDRTVTDIFGYHAVQLGLPHIDTLRENRMPFSALALDGRAGPHGPRETHPDARQLLCRFDELPFDTQSIDLVTLPHILEFSEDPHEVLREVSRVLMPEGRVVVTCFNPMSLWGARQGLNRLGATPFLPSDAQTIGFVRIKDWLKLLGFEIIRGRFGCYCPPYRTDRWLQRAAFMEKAGDRWWPIFGSVYMISAVKRVKNIRLVGPAWKTAKPTLAPVAAPVATPTGTHGKHHKTTPDA
ncbi:Methyltransferase domain-containing protein [Ralstonia sp. 25mfcol4.1]|uniref:class I SAM-dependent methyltransferase n=1 Tax=Ralstonia sp. 25mfcol4.1 TaxID=1761899 RepID=UPI000882B7ED|nr:methyltransferase domain-containing protein [Ralstonia sp. 25mfcol4.1]SDO61743.1 Methyltransferase domain-containing protein [Ralstonia sp. 25mfcol4.1]